jgi:hypothetical protein
MMPGSIKAQADVKASESCNCMCCLPRWMTPKSSPGKASNAERRKISKVSEESLRLNEAAIKPHPPAFSPSVTQVRRLTPEQRSKAWETMLAEVVDRTADPILGQQPG